jgi:hypothetical protein
LDHGPEFHLFGDEMGGEARELHEEISDLGGGDAFREHLRIAGR